MIKLLIVEDSRVVSEYLSYIFNSDPEINVIGNVSNGKDAIEFIQKQKPDVITMDIDMPIMDGLEATRIIMSTTPIPIIIVTASRHANEVNTSMEALASGALAVIEKPVGFEHPKADELARKMLKMVKLMSEVTVITRRFKSKKELQTTNIYSNATPVILKVPEIVAIGVSSGGPQTLNIVFSKISENFPVPILVVQHISYGFLDGLVNWLQKTVKNPIQVATDNEYPKSGYIYFAPDGYHMELNRNGLIKLEKGKSNNGICPSIAKLFTSVAEAKKDKALGIILTGMGSDGSLELKLIRDAGSTTIAQSKESALIYGMPKVAVEHNAVDYILSAEDISKYLFDIEMKTL